jgi:hypothetical protein
MDANNTLAGGGAASISITDTFTRADSALTLGSAETGQPWVVIGTDVFGISTNRAYLVSGGGTSGRRVAYIDTGAASGTLQVRAASSGASWNVDFRITDGLNFYQITTISATTVNWNKVVAGTATLLGTNAALTIADADLWAVVMNASTITIKQNGVTVIGPTADATFTTQTKHGFGQGVAAGTLRFDDYSFVSP